MDVTFYREFFMSLRHIFIILICYLFAFPAFSQVTENSSEWFKVKTPAINHIFAEVDYQKVDLTNHPFAHGPAISSIEHPRLTHDQRPDLSGGHFITLKQFTVNSSSQIVIDFKTSAYVAKFWHLVRDANGKLIYQTDGGVLSDTTNEFMLRHGRTVNLPAGEYWLESQFAAPFFIGPVDVALMELNSYRSAVKLPNLIGLTFIGVFLGLGLYYVIMSWVRKSIIDFLYATFILSNLIFNSATLLVLSDVFNVGWFYWGSITIALSNIAYIIFVMRLLSISKQQHKYLFYAGVSLCVLFIWFLLEGALINPSHANENNRNGVLLFAAFGFICAAWLSIQSKQKYTARWYLLANIGFLGPAIMATVFPSAWDLNTTYASHWGIIAVGTEVILLSFLLSYQLSNLYKEKAAALQQARTDDLTQLPNRFALDQQLSSLDDDKCFTFIDLDGLKIYNDRFGHAKGDELLIGFAKTLSENLSPTMILYRISGDEFGLISGDRPEDNIEKLLDITLVKMQNNGFSEFGISYGTAMLSECKNVAEMKGLADNRMYQQKLYKKNRVQAATS